MRAQAAEIADAIADAVVKGPYVDLVQDCVLVPERVIRHGDTSFCSHLPRERALVPGDPLPMAWVAWLPAMEEGCATLRGSAKVRLGSCTPMARRLPFR